MEVPIAELVALSGTLTGTLETIIPAPKKKCEHQLYSKSLTNWKKMISNLGPKWNTVLKAVMKPVSMVQVSLDATWNTGGSSSASKMKTLAYI